jgi:hypothetical protein
VAESLPNENVSAFPSGDFYNCEPSRGLTKREYFAVFADQPGVAEIVTAAGLVCTDNFWVWKDAETKIGSFADWWAKKSNEERFALSAKVRVQQADALLAALKDVAP